jgi:hypothetical protein
MVMTFNSFVLPLSNTIHMRDQGGQEKLPGGHTQVEVGTSPVDVKDAEIRSSRLLKLVFEGPMRNIDATFDSGTHKRFAAAGLWIRKLRIIDRFSRFSAAC